MEGIPLHSFISLLLTSVSFTALLVCLHLSPADFNNDHVTVLLTMLLNFYFFVFLSLSSINFNITEENKV